MSPRRRLSKRGCQDLDSESGERAYSAAGAIDGARFEDAAALGNDIADSLALAVASDSRPPLRERLERLGAWQKSLAQQADALARGRIGMRLRHARTFWPSRLSPWRPKVPPDSGSALRHLRIHPDCNRCKWRAPRRSRRRSQPGRRAHNCLEALRAGRLSSPVHQISCLRRKTELVLRRIRRPKPEWIDLQSRPKRCCRG